MVITFDELRKVKDLLPPGSMDKIANELSLDAETVRNFFGATHYDDGAAADVHFEKGMSGGVVKIENVAIWDAANKMLGEVGVS